MEERTGGAYTTPVAYSLDGEPVLLSADVPPSTPVLALVPVETNFSAPSFTQLIQEESDGITDSTSGTTTPPAGLYMTFSKIIDDGEAWLKGQPEIEVHVHGPAPGSGDTTQADDLSCAGEKAGGYRQFNQDSPEWSGSVLLFTKSEIDQYNLENSDGFNVLFWEDDDTACAVKTDKRLEDHLGVGATLVVLGAAVIVQNVKEGDKSGVLVGGGLFIAGIYHLANFLLSNDDFLGAAMATEGSDFNFPDANYVILDGTTENGRAMLEYKE